MRQTFAEDVMDKQKKMDRLIKELHNMRAVTGVNTIDKEKYEMEIKRLRFSLFPIALNFSRILVLLVEFVKSYKNMKRNCWIIMSS